MVPSRSCLVLVRRSLWDVSLCHRLSGGGAQAASRGCRSFRRHAAWLLSPLVLFHVDAAVVSEGDSFLRQ